jgi:RNA polymerase sigma-70 factor, ECF subfamily
MPTAIELEVHRSRLRALAYRMLGSAADADDVLQDAYLRWHDAHESVESPGAWLTTTVTRLCLDRLKSARTQRETYIGPWLPEPVFTQEDEVDVESISIAFLLLLERLTPVERAAYLLHAVFDNDHAEVARILGKNEATTRQAFHRAKAHLVAERPRFAPSRERHTELLLAFVSACRSDDLAGLSALLAADARAHTDGGGQAQAARKVIGGRDAVGRFFLGLIKKGAGQSIDFQLETINGWPALVLIANEVRFAVLSVEVDADQIHAIHVVLCPTKLRSISQGARRS